MPRALQIAAPRELVVQDVSKEKLGTREARARTLFSGISHGTEMHVYRGQTDRPFPRSTGYAAVGEVEEVGQGFTKAQPGDRVFAYVRHATEFHVSEDEPVFVLPPGLDPRCGVFTALAGVAYNGVLESGVALGETVVVFGLGVVGLCACHLVRRAGAFRVLGIDPISERREAGLRMGAHQVLPGGVEELGEKVREMNGGEPADVVIETSGAIPALNDALKVIRNQSPLVALSWYSSDAAGLDLTRDFHTKRAHIRVAQGESVPVHLSARWTYERRVRSTVESLQEMPLASLVTHTIPFEEAPRAYELVDRHPEECIQVVLEYG